MNFWLKEHHSYISSANLKLIVIFGDYLQIEYIMASDKDFKSLKHESKGYIVFLHGGDAEKGYRPDYVLRRDNEYIILESENSTSRKAFIGGMLKAAHFLTGSNRGILIFVITPKKNTKVSSIAKQIKKYFDYIRGITNLWKIYVIEEDKYIKNGNAISIDSEEFKMLSECIE